MHRDWGRGLPVESDEEFETIGPAPGTNSMVTPEHLPDACGVAPESFEVYLPNLPNLRPRMVFWALRRPKPPKERGNVAVFLLAPQQLFTGTFRMAQTLPHESWAHATCCTHSGSTTRSKLFALADAQCDKRNNAH